MNTVEFKNGKSAIEEPKLGRGTPRSWPTTVKPSTDGGGSAASLEESPGVQERFSGGPPGRATAGLPRSVQLISCRARGA